MAAIDWRVFPGRIVISPADLPETKSEDEAVSDEPSSTTSEGGAEPVTPGGTESE